MRLSAAGTDDVVRNRRNKSFYRFERAEGERSRIWPLELFPNGLLIPKSQPTIVDADLEVDPVAQWQDDLVVEGKPNKPRAKYEIELEDAEARLLMLQEAYDLLPSNGVGVQSRGSHANKIKAVQARIANIKRGLGEIVAIPLPYGRYLDDVVDAAAKLQVDHVPIPQYLPKTLVQLASGLPGVVLAQHGAAIQVGTRWQGYRVTATVPAETVRPWALARLGTA